LKAEQERVDEAKRRAALEAVKHVKTGFVVGLGSGSTAAYAIEAIGERVRHGNLNVKGIPTSTQAFLLAVKHGIPVTTLDEHPVVDVDIDGVDQVDADLNLIKGMGGALAREKIVASASRLNVIIADVGKRVRVLGENNHPVPVEVLPFAVKLVQKHIEDLSGKPVLREGKGKVGPVITDNGNMIVDAIFGQITDAAGLEQRLKTIPGVVETGLFIGMTDVVYLGSSSGVERLEAKKKRFVK
jgi:ribose 5-phosphate isomerase A